MICERCGEHEAELKVSRVDRDRVLSLNLCAACGRRGVTDAWWLDEEEVRANERPVRERERAVKEVRERGED